jgi:hypothetical protein
MTVLLRTTALLAGGMILMAGIARAGKDQAFDLEQFIVPDTCGGCHFEIYEQWAGSMHNLSHKDEMYNRIALFLRQGLRHEGEIEEAEACVKCHTPVGVVTGFPKKLTDDLDQTPEIATQGIQCDYCHSTVDVFRMYNNGMVLAPGQGEDDPGVKYGPFDDAEPDFHDAEYSQLHTDSRICGTCHNVKHVAFGTDLETTYTEWENSPYNQPGTKAHVSCQGCHMYQRPGIPATGSTDRPLNPGPAADYTEERPHIFTHYFVGGNSGVTRASGFDDKAKMAEERLKHAAEIAMTTKDGAPETVVVSVTNSGAGHDLPTGLGDLRQVWIQLVLTNPDGSIAFASGLPDSRHELPQDTVIFNTVFGDGSGNPVINIAKARQILTDTRIPAGKTVHRQFDLGQAPKPGQALTVRLLYRGLPQKILNLLPGEPAGPMPVVEMAVLEKTF